MCKKCWDDAHMRVLSDTSKSQTEHYLDLLEEREKQVQAATGRMVRVAEKGGEK